MKKNIILIIISTLLTYGAVELSYSLLYTTGVIADHPFWVFENSQKTILFDKIMGYKVSCIPSRHSRITGDIIEYVGTQRGNNMGFPDSGDFFNRSNENVFRIAVLGDSFSAAQFVDINWPDYVESNIGKSVEVLNFSLDGAGLANWYSIVENIWKKQNFHIDLVVFAVFGGDLYRGFTIIDHSEGKNKLVRMDDWHPDVWPKTFFEAKKHLIVQDGYIVDEEIFNKAISNKWRPFILVKIKPYLFLKAKKFFWEVLGFNKVVHIKLEKKQFVLMQKMKQYFEDNKIKTVVFQVPGKTETLGNLQIDEEKIKFAKYFSADFYDGKEAFVGLTIDEKKDCYFPFDGHWNQNGSNKFGEYFLSKIGEYIQN